MADFDLKVTENDGVILVTTNGYLITIITNAIPMSILNLLKSKFTAMFVDKINNTNKEVKHYV